MKDLGQKKPIKKEIKEEKFDVICCLLQPNPAYFYNNVETWFKEIPIRKLYFGCNLSLKEVEILQKQYPEIELIDQREIYTQGKCLADLMNLVETNWFVYLHADVELTSYCFEVMKRERGKDVGIIESNREIWDGHCTTYPNYVKTRRSYSGFQLFQKKAIENIISRIDDDWIFRSEDLIFQNAIEQSGYRYVKSYAMHIHQAEELQVVNNFGIQGKQKIKECQFKAYIKYAIPEEEILIPACIVSLTDYIRKYKMDIYEFFMDFVLKYNKEWGRVLLNSLTGGTSSVEREESKKSKIPELREKN